MEVTRRDTLGIVVIGRNEGERLRVGLKSAIAQSQRVIYVDSGSTDSSIACAQQIGATAVALDMSVPFTAARARNAGFEQLLHQHPDLDYVQFIDGDCELDPDWCQTASDFLKTHPHAAIVCGRRRERFPQHSIFNLLCDLEWDTPVGETLACGGDAMIRATALQQSGGYNPGLIAGEEPELCLRLRQQGWEIFRIDFEMACHDARMERFGQWWKRAVRGGHAYAEVSWIHRQETERFWMRESLRIWLWGCFLPLLMVLLIPISGGWSLLIGLAYFLLFGKLYLQGLRRYDSFSALIYALSCTIIKFPELQGQLWFHFNRIRGVQSSIIEYKL